MADFALVTYEIIRSAFPHACTILREITTDRGAGAYVVAVDPPLLGTPYGEQNDVTEVILAPKWVGVKLRPLSPPLAGVFVLLAKRPVTTNEVLDTADYSILDWGLVFESIEVANEWQQYWKPSRS